MFNVFVMGLIGFFYGVLLVFNEEILNNLVCFLCVEIFVLSDILIIGFVLFN